MSFKIRRDLADIAFSRWVRLRDRECLRCKSFGRFSPVRFNDKGLPVSHEASHFKGRGKENTRFDPENVHTLCTGCHAYFTANPDEHVAWHRDLRGQEWVDEMALRSNFYCKKDRKAELIFWTAKLRQDFGV